MPSSVSRNPSCVTNPSFGLVLSIEQCNILRLYHDNHHNHDLMIPPLPPPRGGTIAVDTQQPAFLPFDRALLTYRLAVCWNCCAVARGWLESYGCSGAIARRALPIDAAVCYGPLDQNSARRYTGGDFLGLYTIGEA